MNKDLIDNETAAKEGDLPQNRQDDLTVMPEVPENSADKKADLIKKAMPFVKLGALILLIAAVPLVIYKLFPSVWYYLRNEQELELLLNRNFLAGIFIYIGVQIAQVVISVIPGEVVQIAGGYIYGIWGGLALSIIGISIGSFLAFRLARLLGRDAVVAIFGEDKMASVEQYLSGRRGKIVIFALFLIPAMPKDMLVYAAGVSSMKERDFYILSMTGRLPALFGSMLMGTLWRDANYTPLIIVAAIVVLIFVACIIFREKLFKLVDALAAKFRRK